MAKKRPTADLADRVRRATRKNLHPETDWGTVKTRSAESVFRKARTKLR